MKVCKFGGSSLADAAQVGKVCDIIRSDPERMVVIVSAPGKRGPKDTKVTDLLIACAESRLSGASGDKEFSAVVERFAVIQRDLGLSAGIVDKIAADIKARMAGDIGHRGKFLDSLKAAGEDNCAKLVAAELCHRGAKARYLDPRDAGFLLSSEFGNAQLLPESYENIATALAGSDAVTVFPGFFGYTREGDIATFPRGGSDITGSILAAAVKADLYENFTDVDSVFSADPRIIGGVCPIVELTYHEMRELSYAGFSVIHDEAIVPVVHAGIPICIRNTNRPDMPGTMIVPKRTDKPRQVTGIASSAGFCIISMNKYLMNREIGFGRRLLQIFEEEGLSYEHVPSGIDNLSIVLREKGFTAKKKEHVLKRIKLELDVDDVEVEHDLALIMLVGEGMRHAVGMAAMATQAFAEAKVNIEMINQGASEISMMFGVKSFDCDAAVKSLYNKFFAN